MKLTDKAILRMVSELPGRNTSEPRRAVGFTIVLGGRVVTMQMTT